MSDFKNILKFRLNSAMTFIKVFAKWSAIASVIGVAGGLVGTAFYKSVGLATTVREANPWLIYLLPAGGVIIAGIYKLTKSEGLDTNKIIDSILLGDNVKIVLTPVIFISTVITHLLGGSAGREGAALQIGGSIGCNIGRLLRLDEKEERMAILSGMSALFSALFGAPVTATVFALEVCSVGIIHYSGLVPCGVAALVAFGITRLFGIGKTAFILPSVTDSAFLVLKVAALAALCALLSVLFCRVMHVSNRLAGKLIPNTFIRAAAGGIILILMTLLVGRQTYNGGGMNIVSDAIEKGQCAPYDFLLKIVFTAVTLSCGFKGGEIVPTFFIGSTFGCFMGPLLGIEPGFAAAVALTALFCGAVNCPLASVILSVELFGSEHIICFAAACFVSYMLSGYASLYDEQKIVYSKLKTEYINIKARK